MAVRQTSGKIPTNAGKTNNAAVEQKVVELAEQLGWFLGTARAKADGWLESDKVRTQVARIRDGAAELLQHIDAAVRSAQMESARPKANAKPAPKADKAAPLVAGPEARKVAAAAKPAAKPADKVAAKPADKVAAKPVAKPVVKAAAEAPPRPSRGLVDAPGKRHRKPPPQEHLDKRMGEPVGKQMGQKSFQVGKSRGRG